jgi:hypothetical protein
MSDTDADLIVFGPGSGSLKGIVARDFWPLVFFHESTPYGPLIHTLKQFRILVRILGDIQI